ncbi:MAG TPA: HD domain-containing phosphohydrolase [Nostocaceae cyanobacterium]|nr:HD domain-containing phosphohydrolase [Nostocaceae cyanobacterium]
MISKQFRHIASTMEKVQAGSTRETQFANSYDSVISKTTETRSVLTSSFNLGLPKILVVENHTDSRLNTVSFLATEGYEVIEADNGDVAIELVNKKQPDLVLMDANISRIDGLQVCQLLKQNQQTSRIPILVMTRLNEGRSHSWRMEAGADDFLIKPFDYLELATRVKLLLQQKHLQKELEQAGSLLLSIAKAVESRDPNTGDHCERLVKLGQAFGQYLQLSTQQIRDLKWGGYLHDIGKVGIPDAVLLKKGQLTQEEWEIMKHHVIIGEEICRPVSSMQGVLPIIRHHHERWDGSGYPDGLVGENIPYLAQVFQLLDIYDALTSERPYKKAFTPQEAIAIIEKETAAGWRNPQLVQQFTEFIRLYHGLLS